VIGALVAVVVIGLYEPWALVGLLAAPLAVAPIRLLRRAVAPPMLVAGLIRTARYQLVLSVLLSVGLVLAS
jgi:1,4-dihydroxy-2-naphthoate octaprenyltransferase